MMLVGIPFLLRAYEWQIAVRMVTLPVALGLVAIALSFLRFTHNYRLTAHAAVIALFTAGFGAILSGGGVGTITMGWWIITPLLAGILLGLRWGLAWGAFILLLCYLMFWLQVNHFVAMPDQTPLEARDSQRLIQSLGLVVAVLVLMGSYLSQIGFSERVLAEKNQSLTNQIQRAEQAEHATQQAIDAKTQFLANMSHELKTPLNSILGFAKRLQGKAACKLDPREAEALNLVAVHGQNLLQLVDDLLELSQIDVKELTLRQTPVSLQEMMIRLLGEISPLAQAHRLKILPIVEEGLALHCDGERIAQVMSYLIRHSIKYAKGGDIRIRAAQLSDDQVLIQISCYCVPLADAEMVRLFDRYNHLHSRVDRDVGCSGLSLPLAYELVQMHRGELSVKLTHEEEMVFDLRLPLLGLS